MDKQDIRYTAAGILLVIGFMLVVGTMGSTISTASYPPLSFSERRARDWR